MHLVVNCNLFLIYIFFDKEENGKYLLFNKNVSNNFRVLRFILRSYHLFQYMLFYTNDPWLNALQKYNILRNNVIFLIMLYSLINFMIENLQSKHFFLLCWVNLIFNKTKLSTIKLWQHITFD